MALLFRTDDKGPLSDREITSLVVQRLHENPFTMDENIKVKVRDGVVVLDGAVDTVEAHDAVVEDAAALPGVADVDDRLYIRAA